MHSKEQSTQTKSVYVNYTPSEDKSIELFPCNLNDLLTQAQNRADEVGFVIPTGLYLDVIQAGTQGLTPDQLWSKIQEDQSVCVGYYET